MEKKMYWIKDLTNNQVIHAPTEEITKKLFKKFRELGLKWRGGYPYDEETGWAVHGEDSCYRPSVGSWCDKLYYLEENYEILTIDQLLDFKEVEVPQDESKDPVNPNHYKQGDIECIDAMEVVTNGLEGIEAVCTANVLKYIWRWKHKNGVEDLKKAKWYLERLIAKQK